LGSSVRRSAASFAPYWDEATLLLPVEVLRDIPALRDCSVAPPVCSRRAGSVCKLSTCSRLRPDATTLRTAGSPSASTPVGHQSYRGLFMADCPPIVAHRQAQLVTKRHEPAATPLARPLAAPLVFMGLDPYEPSAVLRCASGTATRRAHRAIQLEGAALLRELGVKYTLEDRGMFHHLPPPPLVPDITFSDAEQATLWALDFVVADSQGHAAPTGGPGSGRTSRGAEEAGQIPRGVLCYTRHSPRPHRHRDFWRAGTGGTALPSRRSCVSARRAYPISTATSYDAARIGHYYTQRLVVNLLRAQAHVLRRRAVWESRAADLSLAADSQLAAAFERRRDGMLGAADAVYVSMPPVVQVC